MNGRKRKAGKGTTLRLFCADCFLASSIYWEWPGGRGGCVGCAGLVGVAGPYLPGDHVRLGPFRAVGEAYGLCPRSRARPARASPSEVYPAGKLQ